MPQTRPPLESSENEKPRVYLVGVDLRSPNEADEDLTAEESLEEFAQLVDTLGGDIAGESIQRRSRPDRATYIGSGKASELADLVEEEDIDTVAFDLDLSPSQERNLSKKLGVEVMDRTRVILEIFARRAKTREAKAQVDLARMEYFMTHLARQWSHLERQRGSLSARGGPGEKQIEIDRRLLRKNIQRLKKDLEKISRDRALRRRKRGDFFKLALVGYTNAGKSTLLNALTDSDVHVEDRLFATLDSTVRQLRGPFGETLLLTDTVGFIRKLPANLVASFRSTFEEIFESDLLLHVVDLSHHRWDVAIRATNSQLEAMELGELTRALVFNKVDTAPEAHIKRAKGLYPEALFVSGIQKESLSAFRQKLLERVAGTYVEEEVELPHHAAKARASVHELAQVLEEIAEEDGIRLRYRATKRRSARLRKILKECEEIWEEAGGN